MKKYPFKLVGVTFDNRQEHIKGLSKNDKLKLVHEPNNKYDNFAVMVQTMDGKDLGYIPSDYNAGIVYRLNKGIKLDVYVEMITGGEDYNYGVNIVMVEK